MQQHSSARRQCNSTAAVAGLLKQLPMCSSLRLHSISASLSATQHITAMQGLADLDLDLWCCDSGEEYPRTLPQTLTRLVATGYPNGGDDLLQPQPFPSFLASVKQLRQLRVLDLTKAVFDSAHLASLPHLQRLCLNQFGLLPFEAGENGPSAQGTIALLGALERLLNLEHLYLGQDCLDPEQNHMRFASLTASSKLTSLQLETLSNQPLPRHAASCIFSRPLPQLQQLCISVDPLFLEFSNDCENCISKADLRCIVRSCPSLQQLDLRCTVAPGEDVSALLELHSCRVLIVGGRGFGDQQAEVIGQLTWLTELQWHHSPTLTDIGLQQLTTLTNLGRLWVKGCYRLNKKVYYDQSELRLQRDEVRCLTHCQRL
jgi:hypothetical protein